MLLQFPLFIALNRVLSSSIEMYKAPFLWIPDLSGYDPYYILAILITVSMLVNALFIDAKAATLYVGCRVGNWCLRSKLFCRFSVVYFSQYCNDGATNNGAG